MSCSFGFPCPACDDGKFCIERNAMEKTFGTTRYAIPQGLAPVFVPVEITALPDGYFLSEEFDDEHLKRLESGEGEPLRQVSLHRKDAQLASLLDELQLILSKLRRLV